MERITDITIHINTENAAFEGDNLYPELGRILRTLGEKLLTDTLTSLNLRDINGNKVGKLYLNNKLLR